MGKIRAPYYRIVVADSRSKRDGRAIEEIGKYHPTEEPSFIEVNSERAQYWLSVGAQPSPQVEAILKLTGDWGIFKGDKNAKSTVKTKEAKVEFQADEKKKPVLKPKSEKPAAAAPVEALAADEDAAAATGDVAYAAPFTIGILLSWHTSIDGECGNEEGSCRVKETNMCRDHRTSPSSIWWRRRQKQLRPNKSNGQRNERLLPRQRDEGGGRGERSSGGQGRWRQRMRR